MNASTWKGFEERESWFANIETVPKRGHEYDLATLLYFADD
jgi:hypothetical protein